MKRLTTLILVLSIAFTCGLAVALIYKESFISSPDKASDVFTFPNYDVDYADLAGRTDNADGIVLTFGEPTTFNTVVLRENGDVIREFSFYYVNDDGEEIFFYKQDLVDTYRYCSFETITTKTLKISVKGEEGVPWELGDIDVFYMGKTNVQDFRVTAYVVSQYTYKKESLDKNHFKAINHVNLISSVYIAADGELYFRDDYIDGKLVDGKTIFETSLANVREVIEQGTTVVCTLLGQDYNGSGLTPIEIHESAFTKYKDNFIKNAVAFQEKYQLDGLSFDYEYPETMAQYATMFEACRSLKEAMKPGSIMTVALGTWAVYKPFIFDKSLIGCVDWVESMNYDEMQYADHNYHSPFSTSCYEFFEGIDSYNEFFGALGDGELALTYVDKGDLNLGLPFYSRPIDGKAYWGEYKGVAESLGKFENVKYDEYYNGELLPPTYYNSYQMIYDKVCYSIDSGVGGVMVWNYTCDMPWDSGLSLWQAIYAAVESRS